MARSLRIGLAAIIATRILATPSRLTREYDLKAAFLFNFAQFVEWPPEAFPDKSTPITIAILGEDPFGQSLDQIVANETIRNRKLEVHRYHDVKEINACHILFVNPRRAGEMDRLRVALVGRPILTVGETEDFSARSGIIRFVIIDNKVRLRINVEAAVAARLTISSKLLRQAELVGAEPRP